MSTTVATAAPAETVEKKPKLSLVFREAAAKDIEPAAKVFSRAFAEYAEEFKDPAAYLGSAHDFPDVHLVVAEAPDGKIAGLLLTTFNSFARKALHIDQLAVDPDFQGQGVGRELMKKAEAMAIEYNRRAITLHVREGNEKAIRLYESQGFVKTATDWHFYKNGDNGFEMKKTLPANDNGGWGIGKFLKKALGLAP